MKKVIILHGTQSSPKGNWFSWLRRRLWLRGMTVWLPQLPHADEPSLQEWLDFAVKECPFPLDEETIVIGHSSGATLALALAGSAAHKIGAIIAVSPFVPMENPYAATELKANTRLFDVVFDWNAIRTKTGQRIIICSDDDPYIPKEVFEYIAEDAIAEIILLPEQGHFNLEKSSKYEEFPLLLRLLIERGII